MRQIENLIKIVIGTIKEYEDIEKKELRQNRSWED
jgi:hypothetical protein